MIMNNSYIDQNTLESAETLVSDKFYKGGKVSEYVKNLPLYKNRLANAVADIQGLLKAIDEYDATAPAYKVIG